jgi:deoxyribonuclease-4
MDTVQIFTGSPQMWSVPPWKQTTRRQPANSVAINSRAGPRAVSDDDVLRFAQAIARARMQTSLAHNCYLINLASPDKELWHRSIDALALEIQRCDALGLTYLVSHPGAHMSATADEGLKRIALGLDAVHGQTRGARVQVLLELTAGQGTSLGHRFEHIGQILHLVRDPDRLGVCLDTCHVFAAGYPLSTRRQYEKTMGELDRIVGLSLVKAIHLNDSKRELGSRVDRHEHIGRGRLGLGAFRNLLNDPRFHGLPMCLETPKGRKGGLDWDVVNLRTLRRLLSGQ